MLELVDVHSEIVDCLTVALDLSLHLVLQSLDVVRLHRILLANQIVQFLFDLSLLRLHHVHLGVLFIQLNFDSS